MSDRKPNPLMPGVEWLVDRIFSDSPPGGIACDIDFTLADARVSLFDWFFRKAGTDGLTREQVIEKYPYTYDVPHWKEMHRSEDFRALQDSAFHGTLPVAKGAVEGLKRLCELVPISCYATARLDTATVRGATEQWLKANGFPDAPVIMRPQEYCSEAPSHHVDRIKARQIAELHHSKSTDILPISVVVDDSVSVINNLPRDLDILVIAIGQRDLSRIHPSGRLTVVPCPSWNEVNRMIDIAHNITLRAGRIPDCPAIVREPLIPRLAVPLTP